MISETKGLDSKELDESNGEEFNDCNEDDESWNGELPAQEVYDCLLLLRFRRQQEFLRRKPPESVLRTLDPNTNPVLFIVTKKHPFNEQIDRWRRIISSTTPKSAQLAAMDQRSVLILLEVLTVHMTLDRCSEKEQVRNLSVWGWGLLGKMKDLGTLSSEEVSVVREVAKKACSLVRSICQAKERMARRVEQVMNGEAQTHEEAFYEQSGSADAVAGYQSLEEDEEEEAIQDVCDVPKDVPDSKVEDEIYDLEDHVPVQMSELVPPEKLRQTHRNSSSLSASPEPSELNVVIAAAPSAPVLRGTSSQTSPPQSAQVDSTAAQRLVTPHIAFKKDANPDSSNPDGIADERDKMQENGADIHPVALSQPVMSNGLSHQQLQKVSQDQEDVEKSALAMLDTVILIAGTQYGQKDLLGVRERIWGICGAEADVT